MGDEATFCDFFAICGLDPTKELELEKYASSAIEGEETRPPLERSYVGRIVGVYPPTRTDKQFSEDILSLCMPSGLKFCTQKDVPPEPVFHTFANIRADGSRVDGCVLTFYEKVQDHELCEAMQLLHTLHVREITGSRGGHIPGGPLENGYHPPGTVSGGSHTLPRRGKNARGAKRTSYYDSGKDSLFVMKCLTLVTRLPIVSACKRILCILHSLSSSPEPPPLPLESYVYWLLHEIPLPPPGGTLKVTLNAVDVICQRPTANELPFFDYSLRELFDLITVDTFLKVYSCMLLEHQILLCSKSLQRLMLVSESLVNLAFPFRWQHVYVPILPYSQHLFLEAPLPFVMGICYEDYINEEVFQSTVCILDVDSGRIQLPEDLPAFPDRCELVQELVIVFDRFKTITAGSDTRNSRNERAPMDFTRFKKNHQKNTGEWSMKRMSRSFDEDASGLLLENNNSLPPSSNNPTSEGPPSREDLPRLNFSILEENETLARVTEIARRAGVSVTLDSLQRELESSDSYKNSPVCKAYFEDMKFNNAVREIFLNRFTCLLYSYEHFVIGGNYWDRESFFSNRDSMQNFDKASFLSDLPEAHLPFMAAFIETQMFTTFIDWKILSQWEEPEPNLTIFDKRLCEIKEKFGQAMVRTPTYESCPSFVITEELISRREESLDFVVPPPHSLPHLPPDPRPHTPGVFPRLDPSLLMNTPIDGSPWKRRYGRLNPKSQDNDKQLVHSSGKQTGGGMRPPSWIGGNGPGDLTPAQIAQTNWKFVDQLLRETKAKTKRLLVEKMGAEAISLGHTDLTITGVEENTLVASLCDLLERIWAHGVHKKQGKSAFWTHLLAQQELEKGGDGKHSIHPGALLTPDEEEPPPPAPAHHPVVSYLQNLQRDMPESGAWSSSLIRAASFICDKIGKDLPTPAPRTTNNNASTFSSVNGRPRMTLSKAKSSSQLQLQHYPPDDPRPSDLSPSQWNSPATTPQYETGPLPPESPRKRSLSRPRSPDLRNSLRPLPTHISNDLKNVLRMTEIKTEIGYARAFVRLSLERKLLHKHLKTLLGRNDLLKNMYKRYAFLRCEDEKEQFLYHVLSLNAADFRCFTNTFTRTKMQYQAMLVPGGGRFTLSNTAANLWIKIAGSLGETAIINLPKNTLQFTFEHRNLGVLSTLRIGHAPDLNASLGSTGIAPPPPKWFLEYVIVRNELTGHTYKFPCSRWFGRGVEDGSLERLLVAEIVRTIEQEPEAPSSSSASGGSLNRCRTPTRSRSPSVTRRGRVADTPKMRIQEIQHEVGEAVNNIVKHFYRHPEKEQRSRLTRLLCGEKGLVLGMERAFLVGFRSSRFFKQLYPWDYIEKVTNWFLELLRTGEDQLQATQRDLISHMCTLITRITSNNAIGKEEKFQTFILLAVKDHVLSGLLPLMAWTPITGTLYDEPSFLRTPKYLTFLTQLLHALNEFHFDLEHSLTWAVHS